MFKASEIVYKIDAWKCLFLVTLSNGASVISVSFRKMAKNEQKKPQNPKKIYYPYLELQNTDLQNLFGDQRSKVCHLWRWSSIVQFWRLRRFWALRKNDNFSVLITTRYSTNSTFFVKILAQTSDCQTLPTF